MTIFQDHSLYKYSGKQSRTKAVSSSAHKTCKNVRLFEDYLLALTSTKGNYDHLSRCRKNEKKKNVTPLHGNKINSKLGIDGKNS